MRKLFLLVTIFLSVFLSSCDNDAALMELANELSLLLDQLSSQSNPKKNILEERIKKIRSNINKMQQSIEM